MVRGRFFRIIEPNTLGSFLNVGCVVLSDPKTIKTASTLGKMGKCALECFLSNPNGISYAMSSWWMGFCGGCYLVGRVDVTRLL